MIQIHNLEILSPFTHLASYFTQVVTFVPDADAINTLEVFISSVFRLFCCTKKV